MVDRYIPMPPRRSLSPRPSGPASSKYSSNGGYPGGHGARGQDSPPATRYRDDRGYHGGDDRRDRGFAPAPPHMSSAWDQDSRGPPLPSRGPPDAYYGDSRRDHRAPATRRSRSPDDRRGSKRPRSRSPPYRRQDQGPPLDYPLPGPGDRNRRYRDDRRYDEGPPSHEPAPKKGMDDPETLEYEVTFRYFSDYTRSVNMHLANDASALEAAYKRYKSDFERRGVLAFFNVQKDVEWFRERYHPGPEMTQLRENCKRKGREGKMQRFLDELEGGQLDALTLDLDEHAKEELKAKTEEKPTTEEKPDAQSKETGNDDTVMQTENRPALEQEAKPKKASIFVEIQPNDKQLCVKAVPEAITRQDLMDVCSALEGFNSLILSDARSAVKSTKRQWSRSCWVNFNEPNHAQEALKALESTKIKEVELRFEPVKGQTARGRAVPILMNTPERLQQDLEQIRRVATTFEKDEGDSRGSGAIEELHAKDLATVERDESEKDPEEVLQSKQALVRRTLDLYLHYLRRVFSFCYYCLAGHHFAEELQRTCAGHFRQAPRKPGSNVPAIENMVVQSHDDRLPLITDRDDVDPRLFGGETYDEMLARACEPLLKEEDEGKYRCMECNKLFSARKFVDKHLFTKHGDKLAPEIETFHYINNYVLDPVRQPRTQQQDELFQHATLGSAIEPSEKLSSDERSKRPARGLHERITAAGPMRNDNKRRRGGSLNNGGASGSGVVVARPPPEGQGLDPRAARGASSYADLDNAPAGAGDIVLPY